VSVETAKTQRAPRGGTGAEELKGRYDGMPAANANISSEASRWLREFEAIIFVGVS
jgi:hypothetical protein